MAPGPSPALQEAGAALAAEQLQGPGTELQSCSPGKQQCARGSCYKHLPCQIFLYLFPML